MSKVDYKQYIEVNSEIRFGKPIIRGTRIAVDDLLQWIASGMTHEQIIEDFPQLNEQAILACSQY